MESSTSKNSSFLYSEIKNKIKNDIKGLPPHTRISSRTAMMKQYNVTRTTIEKAISELIGEKYLYSINGSGTYIAEREDKNRLAGNISTWGVVIPNIVSDTYPEIIQGIEDLAHEHNINVVICNTYHDAEKQESYILKLIKSNVQGVIIVPAITKSPTAGSFQALIENKIPFVFCNRGVEGVRAPRILSNNFLGGFLATKHLAEYGYRRIAFASVPYYSHSEQRYQGYLTAMKTFGLPIVPEYTVFEETYDVENSGCSAIKSLFHQPEIPDAIVCFNDAVAKKVYDFCRELGIEIGEDMGIVGYDDSKICEMLPVKLTSVRYPKYQTGQAAAEILLKMVSNQNVSLDYTVFLDPELIIRDSTQKR